MGKHDLPGNGDGLSIDDETDMSDLYDNIDNKDEE